MAECLKFIEGPIAGSEHPLGEWTSVTLGRSNACDIRLNDPAVAGIQCTIARKGLVFQLSDHDGSTGTTVNGKPIRTKYLLPDDIIGVGAHRIRFVIDDESDPSRTSVALEAAVAPEEIMDTARRVEKRLATRIMKVGGPSTRSAGRGVLLLSHVSIIAVSDGDRARVLRDTMGAVRQWLPADRGAVVLLGPSGRLTPALAVRGASDPPKMRLQIHQPAVAKAASEGSASAGQAADRAYVCVPLQGRAAAFGALYVDSPLADRAYGDEDIRLLAAVGRQLGLALERGEESERSAAAVRQAQLEARELREILDSVDVVVMTADLEGRVAPANAAARKLFGQAEGGALLEIVPRRDHPDLQAALDLAWEGEAAMCEVRFRSGARGAIRLALSVRPLQRAHLQGELQDFVGDRVVLVGRPTEG